jgi:hypothetical protein
MSLTVCATKTRTCRLDFNSAVMSQLPAATAEHTGPEVHGGREMHHVDRYTNGVPARAHLVIWRRKHGLEDNQASAKIGKAGNSERDRSWVTEHMISSRSSWSSSAKGFTTFLDIEGSDVQERHTCSTCVAHCD